MMAQEANCKDCINIDICRLHKSHNNCEVVTEEHGCNYYRLKDSVVLSKEEYDCLKRIEKSYDPFWFCSFGGCEGVCKECKDTCEMSIFVKERKETAKKIFEELVQSK
jgi:hypothetical protein